jgi:hypothetical protein
MHVTSAASKEGIEDMGVESRVHWKEDGESILAIQLAPHSFNTLFHCRGLGKNLTTACYHKSDTKSSRQLCI